MSSSADHGAGGRISIFEFENRDPTPTAAAAQFENRDPTPTGGQPQGQRRGTAELTFTRRGGRTVLAHSRVTAPMTLVRPFALADGRQLVQLITLGPGFCGGDRVDIAITAESDADVVVTTTAATRVLSMRPESRAEQHVRLDAHAGATIQYYPLLTIPFPESAFTQTLTANAAASARVGVLETWAMGRTARAEYLQFSELTSRTMLHVDGELRYADVTELHPRRSDLAGAAVLAGRRYLASGFWWGATVGGDAQEGAADGDLLLAFAPSRPGLTYLRALASNAPALDATLRSATARVAAAWEHEPVPLDRFRC